MKERKDKVPVKERRETVERLHGAGQSNRSIAREVNVNEGTVRRDLNSLATPHPATPEPRQFDREKIAKNLPKLRKRLLSSPARIVLPPRPVGNAEGAKKIDLQKARTLEAVKAWHRAERLRPRHAEDLAHEAGRLLWLNGYKIQSVPPSTQAPEALISSCRPTEELTDDLQYDSYNAEWLARLLAACLPGDESARDEVLRDLKIWARDQRPW